MKLQYSRREMLAAMAAAPLAAWAAGKDLPVGVTLYSVKDDFEKDPGATLKQLAAVGYQVVEFWNTYTEWTPDRIRQMRKWMDDYGLKCFSTHNGMDAYAPETINKSIDYNGMLGSRYANLARPNPMKTLDDWRHLGDQLNEASVRYRAANMHVGFHNRAPEWKPVDGKMPIAALADAANQDVLLQLDVGTCVSAGADPVDWIRKHAGRIHSMHLKEWAPEKNYAVEFGEGVCPWNPIFAAGESVGVVEYYLIEQEVASDTPMQAVTRCLQKYRKFRS